MLYEKNGELWSTSSHHPLNLVKCEVADVNGTKVIYHTGLKVVGGQATYTDERSIFGSTPSRFRKQTRLYLWERCIECGYTFAQVEAEYRSRFYKMSTGTISHYVTDMRPVPHHRACNLALILNCRPEELEEVFTPPEVRGIGDWWVGERGTRIQDYGMPPDPEEFFKDFIFSGAFLSIKKTQESIYGEGTYVATEEMLKRQEETLGKPIM